VAPPFGREWPSTAEIDFLAGAWWLAIPAPSGGGACTSAAPL